MTDIELVIKIPEEEYALCKKQWDTECLDTLMIAVKYGTPLPKGHGKLIDVSEYFKKEFGDAREFLDKATTIIEADKSESEEV